MKINRLTVIKLLILLSCFTILFSCSSSPKIPVWEISKKGQPNSYLVASSNYLTKSEIDKMLSNKIILLFDSCSTYISLFDLENSDLIETKKWIEIGNNKSLKDTLSEINFKTLKTQINNLNKKSTPPYQTPDSVKIKPQFYLNDVLNRNDKNYFNIEQFFLMRAMPQHKNISGLITLQDYYKAYSNFNYEKYMDKLNSIESLYLEKERLLQESSNTYKSKNYTNLLKAQSKLSLNPEDIITDTWLTKINTETAKQSSFILLDINYVNPENEHGLIKKMLSKGYKLTRVN